MFIPDPLYGQIRQVMPIPCVDLLVIDRNDRCLLLKRRNEPAKGLWWLPGGRVLFGETRAAAALRKLREECGLETSGDVMHELGTADCILTISQGGLSHAICTIYRIEVEHSCPVTLDGQSEAAQWRSRTEWLTECELHPYIREALSMQYSLPVV